MPFNGFYRIFAPIGNNSQTLYSVYLTMDRLFILVFPEEYSHDYISYIWVCATLKGMVARQYSLV